MLAETAHLVVQLDLKNGLKQGASEAIGSVTGVEHAAARAALPMGRLSGVTQKAGDALGHLKGRITGVTQLLGGAGLLGGIAGLAVYAKNAVDTASEWADTTRKIHDVTGMSVQDASRAADAFDKLGISGDTQVRILGFMSKTLGNLGNDTKAVKRIQDDFGFSLTDSKGRMKSNMDILMEYTGYFNDKTIPSQQKAALGNKLFGRSWMDLLPILEQGKTKVKDAMAGAMTMTDDQMAQMNRFRDSQREFNDTMGDLSVQVGMIIIPALTDLAKGLNEFVTEHQEEVLGFFRGMVDGARQLAGFITGTVIPTVSNLASMAKGLWDSIPGPIKDLLIKGFVADRTIKFLFGFSLTDVLKGGIKSLLGGTGLFQRGGSPANPMYVADVTGGMGGGVGGVGGAAGAAASTGIMGKLAGFTPSLKTMIAGGVAMAGGMMLSEWGKSQGGLVGQGADFGGQLAQIGGAFAAGGPVLAALMGIQLAVTDVADEMGKVGQYQAENHAAAEGLKNDPITKNLPDLANMTRLLAENGTNAIRKMEIQTSSSKELNEALTNVGQSIVAKALTPQDIAQGISELTAAQQQAYEYGWKDLGDRLGTDIEKLRAKTPSAEDIAKATAPDHPAKKDAGLGGDKKAWGAYMDVLRIMDKRTEHGRSIVHADAAKAYALLRDGIAGDKQNTGKVREAIKVLERAQKTAQERGATKLARNLGHDIRVLKDRLAHQQDTTNRHLAAIQSQPTKVSVTVPVTTSVSVRDTVTQTRTASRYGFQAS